MKTQSILEECILLAHRINKLGGCVFVHDAAHVEWVHFGVAESKIKYVSKNSHYYDYTGVNDAFLGDILELTELKEQLKEQLLELENENEQN